VGREGSKCIVFLAVTKTSKKKHYFFGSSLKLPRKCRAFFAAQKICQEIIFSWLFVETAKETLWGCLVCCICLNQAGGMQDVSVWLPACLVEPGFTHANSIPQPGSGEMPESAVSAGPGSPGAVVNLINDVLVYD